MVKGALGQGPKGFRDIGYRAPFLAPNARTTLAVDPPLLACHVSGDLMNEQDKEEAHAQRLMQPLLRQDCYQQARG